MLRALVYSLCLSLIRFSLSTLFLHEALIMLAYKSIPFSKYLDSAFCMLSPVLHSEDTGTDLSPRSSQSADRCLHRKVTDKYGKDYQGGLRNIYHRGLDKNLPVYSGGLGKSSRKGVYYFQALMHS